MFTFGILTKQQYLALPEPRWRAGPRTAYTLLDVGDTPGPDDVELFEGLSFTLRTSNGTFRTTYRNRFEDVDVVAQTWLERRYPRDAVLTVQDRAVSHGLTAVEWAERLQPLFPALRMEASDLLLELVELRLSGGATYIADADGAPLQYIQPPFVVPLQTIGIASRHVVNRWLASRARRRFERLGLPENWAHTPGGAGYTVRRFPYVHPRARSLMRRFPDHFQFVRRSVFDRTPEACCALRTMNILNRSYFSAEQLREACAAIHASVQPGGIWIVGRTREQDLTNHVSLLGRTPGGWELLERIGEGAEIEDLALEPRP